MMMRNGRCFMSWFRKIPLFLAIIGMGPTGVRAGDLVPELFLGPAFTAISGTVYAGAGIGGGATYAIAATPLGALEARLGVMPVFGTDLKRQFTITQIHVPVMASLSFLELPRDRHGRGVGGAIGFGLTATVGHVHEQTAFQPSAMVELTFGAFQRGALTLRYQTTLKDVASSTGASVGYHSLVFIASTVW
jgi:hypothetical protein